MNENRDAAEPQDSGELPTQPQWWLTHQGTTTGPHGEFEIRAELGSGALLPLTQACRVGEERWRFLSECPEFAVACSALLPPAPPPQAEPSGQPQKARFRISRRSINKCMLAVILIGNLWYHYRPKAPVSKLGEPGSFSPTVFMSPSLPSQSSANPSSTLRFKPIPAPSNPSASRPTSSPEARLSISWRDATGELIGLVQQFTPRERAALGLTALATGMDIYAARVTLRNTGNVSIRISPANLVIHFGEESARTYTIPDPRFLRGQVLQPGASVTGLVTFVARLDIGASIRFGGGSMSYSDPTIEVNDE